MMKMQMCVRMPDTGLFSAEINRLYAIKTKLLVKSRTNFIYIYFKYLIFFMRKNINPKKMVFRNNNIYRERVLALVLPKPIIVA